MMEGFYYQSNMAVDKRNVTTQMSFSLMTNEASCPKTENSRNHRHIYASEVSAQRARVTTHVQKRLYAPFSHIP